MLDFQVIHCGGAARDTSIYNAFQIDDVNSAVICKVIACLVNVMPKRL